MSQVAKVEPTEQKVLANIEPANGPAKLLELAIDKNLDIDKLEKLMEMQTKWEEKEAKKAFQLALSAFQADLPTIRKTSTASFSHKKGNGHTSYSYASLDEITETIKPFLKEHGLSYRFEQKLEGTTITVRCIVSHSAGHQESCVFSGMPDASGMKNTIQQSASTITYLRRYTLTGALGIATAEEDNDGQGLGETTSSKSETTSNQKYCSEEYFSKNLSSWKKQITDGKRNAQQVIDFINGKGFLLTESQIAALSK